MNARRARRKLRRLRLGLDLGLNLIDTAEMYGEGKSEELVGQAIAGRRDDAVSGKQSLPAQWLRAKAPLALANAV
jgi:aryl-alcohol dehydrogenase-like predicted oxidoreductase